MSTDLLRSPAAAIARPQNVQPVLAPCKRWLTIVNPAAGAMRSPAFRARWLPLIRRSTTQVMFSEYAGHAAAIVAAAKDYAGIAIAGGDGTIHEVLSALDRKAQCLAILPAGRGNSLAGDLGVRTMPRSLAALANGTARSIDLLSVTMKHENGTITRRLCASTVAVGYVASVVCQAKRFRRAGRHSYTLATVLTRPRPMEIAISYDGGPPQMRTRTGVVFSNTAHAGHYRAFPVANLQDGLFDAIELSAGWMRQNCHNACILAQSSAMMPAHRGQSAMVEAQPESPADVLVDGEIVLGVAHLTVLAGLEHLHVQTLGTP